MIKINSELPLCMLDDNMINEYDFVLFHLYTSNDKYREYYLNMRNENPDRLMIFDNSAYEFYIKGEQLDLHEFFKAICELKPDIYILPDVLMSKEKTLEGVIRFLNLYKEDINKCAPNSKPLAVAQGNTEEELAYCLYKYQDMNIKNIAIPFHNSFFKDMSKIAHQHMIDGFCKFHNTTEVTEDMKYALGRVVFANKYYMLLKEFKHIHMLGSHSVAEKVWYPWAHTMDTGYPVKCGIEGYELGCEPHKPEVIIDDFLDKDLAPEIKSLIRHNILKFRNL